MLTIKLKKSEDRRIRSGHPWIYSNEIDTQSTPLKNFRAGDTVLVQAYNGSPLGIAYINPHSLIAARLLSRDEHTSIDQIFFQERLQAALNLRQQLFPKPYYRLVFSEGDNLPGVIIDRFNTTLVMQLNTAGMDRRKQLLLDAIATLLPEITSILLRNDSPIRQQEGLALETIAALGQPPEKILLEENDTQFYAPLWQGQKTGWFYDHRLNRARLKDYVRDKRVLDVFSYLGGWGIQAAKFGAKQVDCIEVSKPACQFILGNAELNGLQDKINIINDDAFDAMKKLQQSGQTYDVIVLDPPAFIKKQKDHKQGMLGYQRLNELALKLLTTGGILVSCSCSMHLAYQDLLHVLQRASLKTASILQILERGHQAPDHPIHLSIPETDYLKMVIARVC